MNFTSTTGCLAKQRQLFWKRSIGFNDWGRQHRFQMTLAMFNLIWHAKVKEISIKIHVKSPTSCNGGKLEWKGFEFSSWKAQKIRLGVRHTFDLFVATWLHQVQRLSTQSDFSLALHSDLTPRTVLSLHIRPECNLPSHNWPAITWSSETNAQKKAPVVLSSANSNQAYSNKMVASFQGWNNREKKMKDKKKDKNIKKDIFHST